MLCVREINQAFLDKGLAKINKGLEKLCEKGALKNEEKDNLLKILQGTTSFDDLKECDMVIEAVFEDIKVKTEVFMSLDPICKKETIFASNTSSLPITQMAARTSRKDRFIGLHFFNPVSVMPLVEVIKTIVTDNKVVQDSDGFRHFLKEAPYSCKGQRGFYRKPPPHPLPPRCNSSCR